MKLPFCKKQLVLQDIPETEESKTETEENKEDEDVKTKKKGIGKAIILGVTALGAAGAAGYAAFKAYKSGDDENSDGFIDMPRHSDDDEEESKDQEPETEASTKE